MRVTRVAYLTLVHFIAQVIFGEEYKPRAPNYVTFTILLQLPPNIPFSRRRSIYVLSKYHTHTHKTCIYNSISKRIIKDVSSNLSFVSESKFLHAILWSMKRGSDQTLSTSPPLNTTNTCFAELLAKRTVELFQPSEGREGDLMFANQSVNPFPVWPLHQPSVGIHWYSTRTLYSIPTFYAHTNRISFTVIWCTPMATLNSFNSNFLIPRGRENFIF
jgi:hypothetical protein